MSDGPLIDFYCHIYPDRFFQEMNKTAPKLGNIAARLRGVTKIHDLDARFREMDEFGDYRSDFAAEPADRGFASGARAVWRASPTIPWPSFAKKHPDRFAGFVAALSLTDVMGSVEEARRAINSLARPACRFSRRLPGGRSMSGVRAALCRHGATRPADLAASRPHRGDARLRVRAEIAVRNVWCFGWPTTPRSPWCDWRSAAVRRYPNLKIITHHLGGMIPYYDGRIGPGLECSRPHFGRGLSKILPSLKRPHLDYMHDFYADTAMFGGGVPCATLRPGIFRPRQGRVRDRHAARPDQAGDRRAQRLDITTADRRKLFSGNAERLLRKTVN